MSDELDALLERWAEGSRLTPEQSAAILTAVIEAPEPGLDPAWLQDLVGHVSGLVVQVATMPEAARAALRTPVLVGG